MDNKNVKSQEEILKVISTMTLNEAVLWSNKFENHIQSLADMIKHRQAIVSFNKFYDNDNKVGNVITNKLSEMQLILNKLYERIDDLSMENLGFDFEIKKFTGISDDFDAAYMKAKASAEKKAEQEFKEKQGNSGNEKLEVVKEV